MKFYVRRTSDHDEEAAPCEGAASTGAPPVSEQIATDPDCETATRFTVEIQDLDALADFAKKYGRIILFADANGDPLLEIYDSYRE